MKALDRKLLRDVLRMRGQMISIALVAAAGVMSAITMRSTLASLEFSRDRYYRDYRMPDVFVQLDRAPDRVAARIAELPGVAAVDTRVTLRAVIDVPGLNRPATGLLISVPDEPRPALGDIHLREGRRVEPGRDDEIVISEGFATANGLGIGDTLFAVLNGRYRDLRIVGSAISPEFVYEIDAASGIFTDQRLFGLLWMSREALAAASDMTGAFDQLVARLTPNASESLVLARIDALLEPYGGLGAYGRADQLSNRLVNDEIAQLRGSATLVPIIFLAVAGFLLHIVLARMIALERPQIATLKAFGYESTTIAIHYLGMALIAIGAGALLGILAGLWLGSMYTDLYSQFFRFPELIYSPRWEVAFGAVTVSVIAALAGAASAIRSAFALQPAEGMRPEAPARFRPLFMERLRLHRFLSPAQRMVVRNAERRPIRTLLSATGVAFSLAVLVIGFIMLDSVDAMMQIQFGEVQREDVDIAFTDARDVSAVREIARLPGVVEAEPYRIIPVRLASGHRDRRLALTGMQPDGRLRAMIDAAGSTHRLPRDGVVLTDRLARSLRVAPGDTIRAELLDRTGTVRDLVVTATVDEMLGINGYMSLEALGRVAREGPRASGTWVTLQRGAETDVLRRLRDFPAVASTTSKSAMLRSFEEQISESFVLVSVILLTLASILAMGVIYNGARIALSERGRELASLRVLGFSRREVAAMLLGEQAIITALGIPLGMLFGAALAAAVLGAFDTELYRVPLALRLDTFAFTTAAILVVAAVAGLLVRRQLDRSDLIAVLKTRE